MRAHEIITSGYTGWEISGHARSALASQFPPRFSDFIGHHITHQFPAKSDTPLPEASNIEVVGYGWDEAGLEALVIAVDGSTTRPDGRIYHVTWSLDREAGFKPKDSNRVLASGWTAVNPINISATARFFTHNH